MDDLARLGKAVRDRRLELGLTQAEAAKIALVSDTTWLSVETGKPASERTYRGIARALQWTAGSIAVVLANGDPIELTAERSRGDVSPLDRITPAHMADVFALADAITVLEERLNAVEDVLRRNADSGPGGEPARAKTPPPPVTLVPRTDADDDLPAAADSGDPHQGEEQPGRSHRPVGAEPEPD
jgi:transcriptional regulator with XRE-family HTH domain